MKNCRKPNSMKQKIHQEFTFSSYINLIIKPFSQPYALFIDFCERLRINFIFGNLFLSFFATRKVFLFHFVSFLFSSDLILKKYRCYAQQEYFISILEMHSDEMVTMCFITGLQAFSFLQLNHLSEVTI